MHVCNHRMGTMSAPAADGETSLLPLYQTIIVELVTLPEILCVLLVDASIDLVEVEASVVQWLSLSLNA